MDIYLDSYGIHLSRYNDGFKIRDREGKAKELAVNKVTRFFLTAGITVTSDAILLAAEKEIQLIFNDRSGFPSCRLWNSRFGSVATIRKNQLRFSGSASAVEWVIQIIADKLTNQMALLSALVAPEDGLYNEVEKALNKIQDLKTSIEKCSGSVMETAAPTLRGLEGTASRFYFSILSRLLPEQYRFSVRSQRPARDMFNSLLNYGYGFLYAKIEESLIKAGLDPAIGVFHRDEYNKPVLVYDVIEKFRVWVEFVVMDLCLQQVIFKEFFEWQENSCWLNQDGKRILIASLNDYFAELIIIKNLSRSRAEHINVYCRELASKMKKLNLKK